MKVRLYDASANYLCMKGESFYMFISIKDGTISQINQLPEITGRMISGIYYATEVEAISPENKRIHWNKCDLFSENEYRAIGNAAKVLERLFDNLFRLNATKEAYIEFKEELQSLRSNDPSAMETVDRRFRAFVFEWKKFLDHWKKYIDDGAQTKYWKCESVEETAEKQKYIMGYQQLYKDVTTDTYDNCEEYVLASAIRNHITHANNAINSSHVGLEGNAVFITKHHLLTDSKISASQRAVIEKCDDLIDLAVVAEKTLEATEHIMEELLNYQIDNEYIDASLILVQAHQKIVEAGIASDQWLIVNPEEPKWEPSKTQSIIAKRIKDKNGNPVDEKPLMLPIMTTTVNMMYQHLNWIGYDALAKKFIQLYQSEEWKTMREKYMSLRS